ncbi:MAG: CDGSH iron-sulfur domain-containing protein [Polyangiaceae bacterium]|nr:CDGSH iron-sulfur domain-containing protein [Polyangiaceae bacterium]
MEEPTIAAKEPKPLELAPGTYYWCACGRSAKQPFCDGSHQGTGFAPKAFEVTERKRVYLCQCKRSANPPFCDGSHQKLQTPIERNPRSETGACLQTRARP